MTVEQTNELKESLLQKVEEAKQIAGENADAESAQAEVLHPPSGKMVAPDSVLLKLQPDQTTDDMNLRTIEGILDDEI